MNPIVFFICVSLVLAIFFMRKKIVEYLFEEFDIYIGSEKIVYITSILFIALVLIGMLMDNTKEKYSDISNNYEKLKPKADGKNCKSKKDFWFKSFISRY